MAPAAAYCAIRSGRIPSDAKRTAFSVLGFGAGGGIGLAAEAPGTMAASRATTLTIVVRRERKPLTGISSQGDGHDRGLGGCAGTGASSSRRHAATSWS